MKRWFATVMVAGILLIGGTGAVHAADWYYINADADDSSWFIDNASVYKTPDMARVLVKVNNVEGFTYIYRVELDRIERTWTELETTVYSNAGYPLLTNKQKQKPLKIEKDTMGDEVMEALWGAM